MEPIQGSLLFIGDLSDSWVVSIAGELARCSEIVQVHCPGDLPEQPFGPDQAPRLIVIHRHRLKAVDAQRLKEYRESSADGAARSIFLCVSPFVRYEELERWSGLVDLVIPESTAADVLPRHFSRLVSGHADRTVRPELAGFRIDVAGGNHDLCQVIVEACTGAGYRSVKVPDLDAGASHGRFPSTSNAFERVLTIWDVPVLEPDWADRLRRRAASIGPVIALLGFADRDTVGLARAHGAIACLELPYNIDDLIDVVDRAARSLVTDRRPMPARIERPHRVPPPPRGRTVRGGPAVVRSEEKV